MRGALKSVRCPPLSKITGERPVCQFCRKPLKPRTWYVEVLGHIGQALSTDALAQAEQGQHPYPQASDAINGGYDASRVFRIEHRLSWNEEPSSKLSFWCGTYDGYGWRGDGMPPLFCSQGCGLSFGVACWHTGMRISEKKPNVSE